MKTISLDLRERIVTAYDTGEVTQAEVGLRFRVSEAMVKKLLQQRRRAGEAGPRRAPLPPASRGSCPRTGSRCVRCWRRNRI